MVETPTLVYYRLHGNKFYLWYRETFLLVSSNIYECGGRVWKSASLRTYALDNKRVVAHLKVIHLATKLERRYMRRWCLFRGLFMYARTFRTNNWLFRTLSIDAEESWLLLIWSNHDDGSLVRSVCRVTHFLMRWFSISCTSLYTEKFSPVWACLGPSKRSVIITRWMLQLVHAVWYFVSVIWLVFVHLGGSSIVAVSLGSLEFHTECAVSVNEMCQSSRLEHMPNTFEFMISKMNWNMLRALLLPRGYLKTIVVTLSHSKNNF